MLSFYLMAELANAKSLSGLFGKLRIGKFSLMIHFVSTVYHFSYSADIVHQNYSQMSINQFYIKIRFE